MMRTIRVLIAVCCALVIGGLGMPGVSPQPQVAYAQQPNVCRALALDSITQTKSACSAMGPGSACYGHETSNITFNGEAADFAPGKAIELARIASLSTTPANPGKNVWGVTMLNIQVGDAGIVRGVLFGEATLTNLARPDAANQATIPVAPADLPVVLRTAASTSQPQVVRLTAVSKGVADARTAKGDWVRVRVENVVGWGPVALLKIEGDVNSLPVLEGNDLIPYYAYPNPMQALTLGTAAKDPCLEAASGLLLQSSSDTPSGLIINGTAIRFGKSTLLVKAVPSDNLEVITLVGEATLTAYGTEIALKAGESGKVRMGGKGGLTTVAAPKEPTKASFTPIGGAPLAVLSDAVSCMAGVFAGQRVVAYGGPDAKQFSAIANLQANLVYPVVGFNVDASGASWWKLNTGNAKAETWVEQSKVAAVGACDIIAKVDPVIVSAGSSSSGGGSTTVTVSGFAPKQRSIWQVEVGADQLVGDCKAGPLNYCAHLAAISPKGANIEWKGQELKPYLLTRIAENTYTYSGRNSLNEGNIKLVVVFNSPTSLSMTQTLVLDSEPGCQHINAMTATFQR